MVFNNVELYIHDNLCDIQDMEKFSNQLSLTYSFSDLYSPDKIVDTYSKTLDLPGTRVNNQIFGSIFRFDSSTLSIFNPSQLTDFYILVNKSLFQKGTLQLVKITIDNGSIVTYKVNLYGQLTNLFSKLLNSDADDPNNRLLRSLNFPSKLSHTLTKKMLTGLWRSGRYYPNDPDGHTGYNLAEYMNYVPCLNGIHDNFDSSKKLTVYADFTADYADGNERQDPYITCKPYIFEDYRDISGNVYEASSEDTKFDEYTTGEYRVEYQRPAVKVNKILQQIVTDSSRDASIYLDSDFFNTSINAYNLGNPYYWDSYLVQPQYNTQDEIDVATGSFDEYTVPYTASLYSPTQTTAAGHLGLSITQDTGDREIFYNQGATNYIDLYEVHGNTKLSFEWLMQMACVDANEGNGLQSTDRIYFGTWNGSVGDVFFASSEKFSPGVMDVSVNIWSTGKPTSDPAVPAWGTVLAYSTPYSSGFDSSLDHKLCSGFYGTYEIKGYSWYPTGILYEYNGYNSSFNGPEFVANNADVKATIGDTYKPADDSSYHWRPMKADVDISAVSWQPVADIKFKTSLRYVIVRQPAGESTWRVADVGMKLRTVVRIKAIPRIPNNADASTYNQYIPYDYGWTGTDAVFTYNSAKRSGDGTHGVVGTRVDITDIFDDTTTQGEFLLNYTKLLGLLYDIDKKGNISIMTRNKYFQDYTIEDWSNKIDYSRQIEINPVPFDSRYYEMKYNNGGTFYEEQYSNKQKIDYGAKRINTGYAFNSDTKELFENILFNNTIMAKEPRYLYSGTIKRLPGSKYIADYTKESVKSFALPAYYSGDKDNKTPADTKFNLLFKSIDQNNYYNVSKRLFVSEDSSIMLSEDASINGGQYCWIDYDKRSNNYIGGLITSLGYVPKYVTHEGDYSWDIGYPRVSYDGATTSTYDSSTTVYERFWANYIKEIYNANNKIMTCYVNLTFLDLQNFSFKKFVKINGVLWHPNKLIDVNPLTNNPTKVEFIKVTDLNAYINGQNISDLEP